MIVISRHQQCVHSLSLRYIFQCSFEGTWFRYCFLTIISSSISSNNRACLFLFFKMMLIWGRFSCFTWCNFNFIDQVNLLDAIIYLSWPWGCWAWSRVREAQTILYQISIGIIRKSHCGIFIDTVFISTDIDNWCFTLLFSSHRTSDGCPRWHSTEQHKRK